MSAADWASLGLLSAWGRWDEEQHWLSLSTTAWVSQVLKLHLLPIKAAELPHSWQFWNQHGLCLALRGNSTVQPGNEYIFYPVTVYL